MRLVEKRRTKEVKLNRLSSISGGGGVEAANLRVMENASPVERRAIRR